MKVQGRAAGDKRLGLTTIAERVRLLGGDLKISSAKGQGTSVAFCIPVSRVQPGAAAGGHRLPGAWAPRPRGADKIPLTFCLPI